MAGPVTSTIVNTRAVVAKRSGVAKMRIALVIYASLCSGVDVFLLVSEILGMKMGRGRGSFNVYGESASSTV
jgi:hypothetical protein